jgi:hypothetical protein
VATAGDNKVRFRNVAIDLVRVEPDGTVIESIAGHQPVEFTGVMKINLDTGQVIAQACMAAILFMARTSTSSG